MEWAKQNGPRLRSGAAMEAPDRGWEPRKIGHSYQAQDSCPNS
jgi:hypothetical protein